MRSVLDTKQMLVGTDADTLRKDCRRLRSLVGLEPPDADEVIAFLDGYNSFINHMPRPFSPMREINMLL
jgi:hypothetical protein